MVFWRQHPEAGEMLKILGSANLRSVPSLSRSIHHSTNRQAELYGIGVEPLFNVRAGAWLSLQPRADASGERVRPVGNLSIRCISKRVISSMTSSSPLIFLAAGQGLHELRKLRTMVINYGKPCRPGRCSTARGESASVF
jgi:hypothetical protein